MGVILKPDNFKQLEMYKQGITDFKSIVPCLYKGWFCIFDFSYIEKSVYYTAFHVIMQVQNFDFSPKALYLGQNYFLLISKATCMTFKYDEILYPMDNKT